MLPKLSSALAGAVFGAGVAIALSAASNAEDHVAQAAAPQPRIKYEYQVVSIDMVNRTVTVGDQTDRFSITEDFNSMLNQTAQKGGWRIVNTYTIGAFGPFFVMERLAL